MVVVYTLWVRQEGVSSLHQASHKPQKEEQGSRMAMAEQYPLLKADEVEMLLEINDTEDFKNR